MSGWTPEEVSSGCKSQTFRVQLSLFGSNAAANAEEEELRCEMVNLSQPSIKQDFELTLGGWFPAPTGSPVHQDLKPNVTLQAKSPPPPPYRTVDACLLDDTV